MAASSSSSAATNAGPPWQRSKPTLRSPPSGARPRSASVSEASARLASVEGERRTLDGDARAARKVDRAARPTRSRPARLQARNLELEGERHRRTARQARARARRRFAPNKRSYAEDAAPDRDELHRLENHERTIQDEFNEAQAVAARDRPAAGWTWRPSWRARPSTSSTCALEMEREGLAPDRTGQVVALDDAMATEPCSPKPNSKRPASRAGADVDVEEMRARIEELRRQIRRLGPINAEAPEDFQEFKDRHEFLTTPARGPHRCRGPAPRRRSRDLNEEIRTRFSSDVRHGEREVRRVLLRVLRRRRRQPLLTDPHNLAEAGIEIEAQPPGKRIKSLSLLSGGERSLTAVALLFALLAANPAPFCVLDEVDAALDEANVGRFTARSSSWRRRRSSSW